MEQSFIPVILAGGRGERFWPLSRQHRPKQFLCLDGSGQSLLQATAERLLSLGGGWQGIWVVTASQFSHQVEAELPLLPVENLLIEPQARDTAAAVTWTSLEIYKRYGPDTVIGFFPADHWIEPGDRFPETVRAARELASREAAIVTLGIQPTYPATGYGYIEMGESWGTLGDVFSVYRVQQFTEKPDYLTATTLVNSGRFCWNSGIFIFRAEVALGELERYAPEIYQPLQVEGQEAYAHLPRISIDYALMEKTDRAFLLPVTFLWDDLGDWNALARLSDSDRPNVELAQHVYLDTRNTIISASNPEEVIVTLGLEDVVIVRDGNVTLVARKDRTQEIKQVLSQIRADPKYNHLL